MKLSTLLLLPGSFSFVCVGSAQESSEEPSHGPDGGTSFRVHGIQVLPATGKPFSARDSIKWNRKLEDGTTVTMHLYAAIARDGQGRIYREHRSFVAADSKQRSKRRDLVLLDPSSTREPPAPW
jgi:hypothetical protein